MSVMSVSTSARPDGQQRDPRLCLGQHVHPHRRGDAETDLPLALANCAGRLAAAPAEPLGAAMQRLGERVGGERLVLLRVARGDVAQAQLDRIEARRLGQLVHRVLEHVTPTASPGARTEPAQVRCTRATSWTTRRLAPA